MAGLFDLVIAKTGAVKPEGSEERWYCRLSPADNGGAELYRIEHETTHAVHVVRAQGARCRTLPEACETLANALEFPGYYGRNTDAFNECLFDLLDLSVGGLGSMFGTAGRPANSLVLMIDTAEQFLRDETPEKSRSTLLSTLSRAANDDPAEKQASFLVAFIGETLPPSLAPASGCVR